MATAFTDQLPALGVVIACRDSEEVLARQLDALAAQDYDGEWEVVVADNGSHDASIAVAERARRELPNLVVLDASQESGVSYARNAGAGASEADALLFVDADDEVAPGFLTAMGCALADHDFVCARYDPRTLNEPWAVASRGGGQSDGVMDWFKFLPYAGGGGIGVRREVFDEVGGFDEVAHLACEDVDFCWRVQLAGHDLTFVPDAVVHVRYRTTLWSMFRQGRAFGRGEAYLYKQYRDFGMPGVPWKLGAYHWWRLAVRLAKVRDRAEFAHWFRSLAIRLGRLEGSVRYGVQYW